MSMKKTSSLNENIIRLSRTCLQTKTNTYTHTKQHTVFVSASFSSFLPFIPPFCASQDQAVPHGEGHKGGAPGDLIATLGATVWIPVPVDDESVDSEGLIGLKLADVVVLGVNGLGARNTNDGGEDVEGTGPLVGAVGGDGAVGVGPVDVALGGGPAHVDAAQAADFSRWRDPDTDAKGNSVGYRSCEAAFLLDNRGARRGPDDGDTLHPGLSVADDYDGGVCYSFCIK